MDQSIQNLMKTTMENIKSMIDVDTVIGNSVETKDGTIIIPISKVALAFASGGGEMGSSGTKEDQDKDNSNMPFLGGGGAGVSVQPVGFLIVSNGQFRILPVNQDTVLHRLIDYIPDLMDNLNDLTKKNKNKDDDKLQ